MRTSAMEDWALAATFVFAVAFSATIHEARHFQAEAATAEATPAPQFVMTVTAKRLPASCRGAAALANSADCARYLQADAVVEMHEAAPAVASR
jgi:hypothetical protein